MKYMILICPDPTIELSEEEKSRVSPDAQAWVAEMEGRIGYHLAVARQQMEPGIDRAHERLKRDLAVEDTDGGDM